MADTKPAAPPTDLGRIFLLRYRRHTTGCENVHIEATPGREREEAERYVAQFPQAKVVYVRPFLVHREGAAVESKTA